jgi:uncharacterized cupin superfamily protein
MDEARIEDTGTGRVAEGDGWFVLNVADGRQRRHHIAGAYWSPEPDDREFADFGINIHVLEPGQPNGLYHAEVNQEDFLVLHGECLLLVEGQERRLRAWDFVHCPAGTEHIFVGAGDGPCAILMVGGRQRGIRYPASELAARHGASAETPTDDPREAYASWGGDWVPERMRWPL